MKIPKFNRDLATGIFAISIIVWVLNLGVMRFVYEKEMSLISMLVYFDMTLLVSLISGLMAGKKEKEKTLQSPRFVPFVLPCRNGIFDNKTEKPYMEDADKTDLLLGLLTDVLNRLDKIENK
jgi:hypothetical protein